MSKNPVSSGQNDGALPGTNTQDNTGAAPATGTPASPGGGAPPPPSLLEDNGVPSHLVWAALGIGTLFTAVGGLVAMQASRYTPGVHFAALIACCGLGMVLVAVGGKAVGTWKSWSLAGAAAAAPVLFLLQWELQPPAEVKQVRGQLHGTGRFQQVTMWGFDGPFYVRKPSPDQDFQFVATDRQVAETTSFFVTVVNEEGKSPRAFTINCLSGDILRKNADKSIPLALTIRPDGAASGNPTWFIYSDGKKLGRYNEADCDSTSTTQSVSLSPTVPGRGEGLPRPRYVGGIIGTAYAQPAPKSPDLEELLSALDSESSDLRVGARVELSKLTQPDQLKAITERWNTKGNTYRRDLGLLTAWNTAIANDRATAVRIAEAFSPSQVIYLTALTGYPDQTMRYGATRLVSWFVQATAWPNGVTPAKGRIIMDAVSSALRSPTDAAKVRSGIHFESGSMTLNLLAALDWSDCLAVKLDRSQTVSTLESLAKAKSPDGMDGRVRDLATKLLERLAKCP